MVVVGTELIQSEIVVSEGYWRKRAAYFKQQNERARHELRTVGYTILRNLVRRAVPSLHRHPPPATRSLTHQWCLACNDNSCPSDTFTSCGGTTDGSSRPWAANQRYEHSPSGNSRAWAELHPSVCNKARHPHIYALRACAGGQVPDAEDAVERRTQLAIHQPLPHRHDARTCVVCGAACRVPRVLCGITNGS